MTDEELNKIYSRSYEIGRDGENLSFYIREFKALSEIGRDQFIYGYNWGLRERLCKIIGSGKMKEKIINDGRNY